MSYNGHRNRNAWNVSLWINNDERLYRGALSFVRAAANLDQAAHAFWYTLKAAGETHTPDSVPYTVTNIRLALRGMRD
jgi:hypothetical protein